MKTGKRRNLCVEHEGHVSKNSFIIIYVPTYDELNGNVDEFDESLNKSYGEYPKGDVKEVIQRC